MNTSLFTNFTNNQTNLSPSPYEFLFTVDLIFRWYGFLIFVLFGIILIFSKSMHTKAYIYINHCVLVSSIYCYMMFVYLLDTRPNFSNALLNQILCSISEIVWIFGIYIRTYSILLIAIQRYIAVFKIGLFKKLNSSLINLSIPLIIIWAFSIAMPIITKYAFDTSASVVFCLDGYSPLFNNIISYIVVNYTLMIILPSIVTIIIYCLIIRKLSILDKKIGVGTNASIINNPQPAINNNSNSVLVSALSQRRITVTNFNSVSSQIIQFNEIRNNSRKNRRFANQFLFMCFTVIASSFVHTIFSLRSIIFNYYTIFYYWRPFLRSYLITVISLIPIITIYYHPSRHLILKWLRSIKNKL
jgi:hypothetical protein